jgi:hypothetical protein
MSEAARNPAVEACVLVVEDDRHPFLAASQSPNSQ